MPRYGVPLLTYLTIDSPLCFNNVSKESESPNPPGTAIKSTSLKKLSSTSFFENHLNL